MSARPFYKRYASDFIAGVAGLSAEQIGVYTILLDLMYARRKKLETKTATDVQGLARACGCTTRRFNQVLAELIGLPNKITRDRDGLLSNPKFERMLAADSGKSTPKKENKQGGIISDFRGDKSEIIHHIIPNENQTTLFRNKDLAPLQPLPTRARARLHIPDSKIGNGGGSAAPKTGAAEHMPESAFEQWWTACAKTIPRGASKPAALRRWRALPIIPTDHLVEAWHAYVDHNREQSKGSRYRQKTRHPESWLKDRVYESFLEIVEQRIEQQRTANAARDQRNRQRAATIENWNGRAQHLIAKIGERKFDIFIGTTVSQLDDGTVQIDFHQNDFARSDAEQTTWASLEAVFGKGKWSITSDQQRKRHAEFAARRAKP